METPPTQNTQNSLAEVDNALLEVALLAKQDEIAQHLGKIGLLENKVDSIQNLGAQQQKSIHDFASTAGQRQTLDPHSPNAFPGRTPEGIISTHVVKPIIKKKADKFSVHIAGNETEGPGDRPNFDASTEGATTQIRDFLSTGRNAKQIRKQQRARSAEQAFGVTVGHGKKTGIGSRINRGRLIAETVREYRAGDIDADTASVRIRNRKGPHYQKIVRNEDTGEPVLFSDLSTREVKPLTEKTKIPKVKTPKAVNREVRRERRGALYNLLRTKQPISGRIRKYRLGRAAKKLDRAEDEFRTLNQQRIQLMLEKDRREDAKKPNVSSRPPTPTKQSSRTKSVPIPVKKTHIK